MTLRIPALVTLALAVPQIAWAQSAYVPPDSYQRPELRPISLLNKHYLDRMTAIRQDAVALRASDGGTLTDEHRAMIQARNDKVEAGYRRELRRNNPMSVGADGSPVG
ncbi:MAG: hypothetical protein EOP61_41075 [Sphingomonadales bacterium]|nr:MAG: hypothetical protein EOP61_41075 [Sphingomonadales bacterium]